jgi:endonuclease-3
MGGGDRRVEELARRLRTAIPDPRCELDFESPWQLLIATILSAQNTDRMVNRVTPELFRRWPDPEALAAAAPAEVEQVIKPTGFFRSKTKAILGTARAIAAEHHGQVPQDMAAMLALPGVARKTANVVLGIALGRNDGIAVDTHVGRVARRLQLAAEEDAEAVERALCALVPRRAWTAVGHRLLLHGRYVCRSKAPLCDACPLNELCPSAEVPPHGTWTVRARAERARVEARGGPPAAR